MSQPRIQRPDGAGFTEPWQAKAFALVVALQKSGCVAPEEWSAILGEEIEKARAAGDPADGTTYHNHLLSALERLIRSKGFIETKEIDRRHQDWEEAYLRTPHGQPVLLKSGVEAE